MQSIRLEWEGPLSVDDVINNIGEDYGLYQIYGKHIIFGEDSPLYIGKTDTSFSKRIKAERDDWIWYDEKEGAVYIYVARDVPRSVLADAEALLIYWHSPPYNSANIYDYTRAPLQIENDGEHHSLVKHLSTKNLPWYKTLPTKYR